MYFAHFTFDYVNLFYKSVLFTIYPVWGTGKVLQYKLSIKR